MKPSDFYKKQKIVIADFYYWKDIEKFMKKLNTRFIDKKEVLKAIEKLEQDLVESIDDLELQDINATFKNIIKGLELEDESK